MVAPVQTLDSLFEQRVARSRDKAACWRRVGGAWSDVTWADWHQDSLRLASALRERGVERGAYVAILSGTRYEWLLCEQAIARLGAISVALPPDLTAEQCQQVLRALGVRCALVEGPSQLAKLLERGAPAAALDHVIYFDVRTRRHDERALMLDDVVPWPPGPALESLDVVLEEQGEPTASLPAAEVEPEDPATLVFSSGATGPPRAVCLTHGGLVAASRALVDALALVQSDVLLVVLPASHVLGRVFLHAALHVGLVTAFPEEPAGMLDCMGQLRPTVVAATPWMFERIHARVLSDAGSASPLRRAVYRWALRVGREASEQRQGSRETGGLLAVRLGVAHRLVFRRLHELLGGQLRFFVSAGGALSQAAAELFHTASVLVLEAYGQTEAGGIVHINRPDAFRFGSVGQALEHVRTRVDDAGEVLVDGLARPCGLPVGMPWARDDDDSRWDGETLRTEDLGRLDEDGYLYLEGRRSDMIRLGTGATVSPAALELALSTDPLINQVAVFGDARPFVTALVTLDQEVLARWADEQGLARESHEALTQHQQVYAAVERLVQRCNQTQPPASAIKKFAVLSRGFSVESGELTALHEVRREVVATRHATIVDSFYAEQY